MNDAPCPLARQAGPTLHLPPDQAMPLSPAEGWVLLQGVATLETTAPAQVVQLVCLGDLVGGAACTALQGGGALLRALTPCVWWRWPEPADQDERLRVSLHLLAQQALRAREMAALRTGGTALRLKRLLALLAPTVGAAAVGTPAASRPALPPLPRLAAVVGLPPATVKRALDRLAGTAEARAPAQRPWVSRSHRAGREATPARPPDTAPMTMAAVATSAMALAHGALAH